MDIQKHWLLIAISIAIFFCEMQSFAVPVPHTQYARNAADFEAFKEVYKNHLRTKNVVFQSQIQSISEEELNTAKETWVISSKEKILASIFIGRPLVKSHCLKLAGLIPPYLK